MIQTGTARALNRAAELQSLLTEVEALRGSLLEAEREAGVTLEKLDARFRDSSRNFIHYLALRRHDIRGLQERLASLGLSSLGRAESHVLHAVDNILSVLAELNTLDATAPPPAAPAVVDRQHGKRLLIEHTELLMGPVHPERAVRIMVTMPGEAAHDYNLVHQLLQQGMDCMRINCAHDDATVWTGMIEHLRRAEQATRKTCKVLMDLGGPKLRTGPLTPGAEVLKVRPHRDVYGQVAAPARLWLTPAEQPCQPPTSADGCLPLPQAWLETLGAGDRVEFSDARRAGRSFRIVEAGSGGCWAEMDKTAYFTSGMPLSLRNADGRRKDAAIGTLPALENPLLLHHDDLLIVTRDAEPGRRATFDSQGRVLTPARIGCIPLEAFSDVRPGEHIWFDDGKIGGVVERADTSGLSIRIIHARPRGEKLRGEKGINLPDSRLQLPALTAKDLEDLRFVVQHADMVGLSFANSADDVRQLRGQMAQLGHAQPAIVLKIETRRGFENLPEMLLEAMQSPRCGVMIARGDLAVECGFERMAEVQEEILWLCESAHVPVIWATQVLENLAREGLPSRAEITDAAMAHRAECVMLNKGPHIVDAVRTLDDILRRMQLHQTKKSPTLRALNLAKAFSNRRQIHHRAAAAAGRQTDSSQEQAAAQE